MDPLQILIIFGAVLAIFALLGIAASRYRKVGPNEAMIVYGRGSTLIRMLSRCCRISCGILAMASFTIRSNSRLPSFMRFISLLNLPG